MSEQQQRNATEYGFQKATSIKNVPQHSDWDEYTKRQLRARVALKAGCRTNPQTSLNMATLNSAIAYLIGSFSVHPRNIQTSRSPGREYLRKQLAVIVHNRGYGLDEYMDTYVEELPDDYSYDATGPDDSDGEYKHTAREFRRSELVDILECMNDYDDSREWTQC